MTAHQWDETQYQWRNIGLYSHTRQRIEGQIATARLRGSNIPYNTIEYFKAVVEQRETQSRVGSTFENAPLSRLGLRSNPDHYASLSSLSPTSTGYPSGIRRADSRYDEEPETVVTQRLEDPFVTPARSAQSSVPMQLQFGSELRKEPGSMDLGYQFPPQPSVSNSRNLYAQQEPGRLAVPRSSLTPLDLRGGDLRTPLVDDNAYEQDYLIAARTPARPTVTQGRHILQPSPSKSQSEMCLIKTTANLFGLVIDHLSVPHINLPSQPARRFSVLQGATVANPNRGTSTLNANAQPYTRMVETQQEHECETETNLRFSDPDITARDAPTHEIINGLSQQPPTPQNFKGPFFTDNMPTTRNPTTARAVQIEEETKLHKWFHDGENPARRQDFTRSLMASAMSASSRTRGTQNVGTIGEPRVTDSARFDNTPIFVRLYEVLSEYRMETRGEKQRDYFTRNWKVAELKFRDMMPGGNESFFQGGGSAGVAARPGLLPPVPFVADGRGTYLIPQIRRQRF